MGEHIQQREDIKYCIVYLLSCVVARSVDLFFFFKVFLFIYDSHRERVREREREAETQAEEETDSMLREPDVGFDPESAGSRPGPKAGAKPLRHPGIPGA